jgi:hypothetical protein
MRKRAPMQDEARQRAWNSIRILRRFQLSDLETTADISHDNVKKYVAGLCKAGYIRIATPRASGVAGGGVVYQLLRDTGPFAPRFGNHGVHDPNVDPRHAPEWIRIPKADYERALLCARACQGMTDPIAEVQQLRALAAQVQP